MPAVFLETAFCLPQPHYCHFKLRFHLISIGWGRAQLPALSADALPETAGCSMQGSAAIHLQAPWFKVEEHGTYTFTELSTLRKSSGQGWFGHDWSPRNCSTPNSQGRAHTWFCRWMRALVLSFCWALWMKIGHSFCLIPAVILYGRKTIFRFLGGGEMSNFYRQNKIKTWDK